MIVDQKINKQFVGVYLIDGTVDGVQFATTKKPNLFRRLATRLLIGWRWVDVSKLKTKQKLLSEKK